MAGARELPNHADLQPYNLAVAGHEGTLCDPDGELFIKPCVQQEIDFYETAFKEHPNFAELMPVYLGTLSLNDMTDVSSVNEQLPVVADHMSQGMKEEAIRIAKAAAAEAAAEATTGDPPPSDGVTWKPNNNKRIATNKSVVLENAAYGFKRPNILDAKLGRRLWADDAPLEKKQRFDKISKTTTNGSHGFRIAGMRVYKGSDNAEELDSEGYKIYGKDHGMLEVNKDNVVREIGKFIFNERAGIDEDLGKAIAQAFLDDLRRVEQVLSSEETRMYSASLLFTFEGDGEALRAAIEKATPSSASSEQDKDKRHGRDIAAPISTNRVDSGIVVDDDGEIVLTQGKDASIRNQLFSGAIEGDVKVLELAGNISVDGEDDEEEFSDLPRIYSLKLIDFAHAEWVPGQGPDENSLLGVRSLIKIFEELCQ
ncbi:Inositol polyphosphate multikinase [Madurella mycetomatis]|uniref:Kinase n=1 Tax=Madurella mycetomatis TaxID=100816 RepID=A0A175VQF3_9PEZI|nr:Inositol polyphosphate multikinase [Madurella mycetomatis]KXX76440.1 Inositol polyphosphate multikinase [Madurella mycetomatis]